MSNERSDRRKGYRGIREGTKKEAVAKIFRAKGPDQAFKAGRARRLKESTLKTWISTWSRDRRQSAAA